MCRKAKYRMGLLVRHFRKVIRKVKMIVKQQKKWIRWQQLAAESLTWKQVHRRTRTTKTMNRYKRVMWRDHQRMASRCKIIDCHRDIVTTSLIWCLRRHRRQGRLLHRCRHERAHRITSLNRRWCLIHSRSTNNLHSRSPILNQVVHIRNRSKMACVLKIHFYSEIKRMSLKGNMLLLDSK